MIRFVIALFVAVLLSGPALAEDSATRDEVVAMCKEAAALVLNDREAGIREIGDKDGRFVWKDTYVFLMDFEGHVLAHPMHPELVGKGSLLGETDMDPKNPKPLFAEFVEVARKNGEGWVWYMWTKPGEQVPSKKFTFISRVGRTDMFVGAGIYK